MKKDGEESIFWSVIDQAGTNGRYSAVWIVFHDDSVYLYKIKCSQDVIIERKFSSAFLKTNVCLKLVL